MDRSHIVSGTTPASSNHQLTSSSTASKGTSSSTPTDTLTLGDLASNGDANHHKMVLGVSVSMTIVGFAAILVFAIWLDRWLHRTKELQSSSTGSTVAPSVGKSSD
jgi:hypothetical protein